MTALTHVLGQISDICTKELPRHTLGINRMNLPVDEGLSNSMGPSRHKHDHRRSIEGSKRLTPSYFRLQQCSLLLMVDSCEIPAAAAL